jgi:hypothetical protein
VKRMARRYALCPLLEKTKIFLRENFAPDRGNQAFVGRSSIHASTLHRLNDSRFTVHDLTILNPLPPCSSLL